MFSRTRLSGGWTRETSCIVKMNSGMPSRITTNFAEQEPLAQAAWRHACRGRTERVAERREDRDSQAETAGARRLHAEPDELQRVSGHEAFGRGAELPSRNRRAGFDAEHAPERACRAAAQKPRARRERTHVLAHAHRVRTHVSGDAF